jgi:alpha-tubulin suppressor-like RCC1 family protein
MSVRTSPRGAQKRTTLVGVFSVLALAGCPAPSDPPGDTGLDASADAGGETDVPVTGDSGMDAGNDAGRETDCAGDDCDFVEIAAAALTTCARRENGTVLCWGYAEDGEVGDGRDRHSPSCPPVAEMPDVDCSSRPVLVDLAEPALELEAGAFAFCAVTGTDREHHCWGERGFNIGTDMPMVRRTPEVESLYTGVTLDDGQFYACWIDPDGGVSCIGNNSQGQLGNGSRVPAPTPVAALRASDGSEIADAVEIASSVFGGNTCARTATEVLCWGTNDRGQLGDGVSDHPDDCGTGATSRDCSQRAVPVTIDAATVLDIAIGFDHACALMADGEVMCWGGNALGQLGLGTNEPVGVPTEVPGVDGAVELSVNGYNTCVRLGDGRAMCWGQSNLGQVGDGEVVHDPTTCANDGTIYDCQMSPVFVLGLDDATAITTGFRHSCAIRETNEIVCWGENERFQLGNPDREASYEPSLVTGL